MKVHMFHMYIACRSIISFLIFICYSFSSVNEDEDDGTAEFQACIKVLAEKVSILSRHQQQTEAAHGHLVRELEEKKELIKSLYTKLQLEKQVGCMPYIKFLH